MREARFPLPGILALMALGAGAGVVGLGVATVPEPALAYRHHASRIHYQDYAQAAFDQARRENKPVYVLLSAAWCFWCRVFQDQTLERPEVARLMNEQFVPVFVDLDQRPDLQQRYVRKGIPTSVIFTPEGEEYLSFAGTLKKDEFLAGIRQVLARIHQPGGAIRREAAPSVRDVRPFLAPVPGGGPSAEGLEASARTLRQAFAEAVLDNVDPEAGGLGRQNKYPLARVWEALLARGGDGESEAGPAGPETVSAALAPIARHLYDPVDGGFFRYADNRDWSRPHTEKMLTTNARLVRLFAAAADAAEAGAPEDAARWRTISGRSLGFVLDVLYRADGGGFYGSLDGRHPRYYRLDAAGRARARAAGRAPEVAPTLYTAWNAEAVAVLADVQRRHPQPRLRAALEATLRLLHGPLLSADGGLYGRLRPGGAAEGQGQLTDNAWGALAFVAGLELTGDPAYREAFERVLAYARRALYVPEAHAYRAWNVPGGRGWRTGENVSEAVPLEGNAVMALALARAYRATGRPEYRAQAAELLQALGRLDPWLFDDDPDDAGKRYLAPFVHLLRAQDLLIRGGAKPS